MDMSVYYAILHHTADYALTYRDQSIIAGNNRQILHESVFKMLFKHYRVHTNHSSLIVVVVVVVICHCSCVSWCYMTRCGTHMLRSKRKEIRITVFQVQYPRKSCHVSQKSNSPQNKVIHIRYIVQYSKRGRNSITRNDVIMVY